MQKKDCFYLGKIIRRHGFKGEVLIKLDTDEPELYSKLESAFLEIDGMLVPFFFARCTQQHNANLRILFEDIPNEQIDRLIGASVYLPLSFLPQLSDNQFYFHEIEGYKVIDTRYGAVGTILRVNDSGPQALFEIENNNKEVLIPVNDDFIKNVDKKNRIIEVTTPEGLIELYLG